MIRQLTSITAVVAVAALMSSGVFAQDQAALTGHVLADTVDGMTLKTNGGESIGEIDDLIIDTTSKRVAFVIVSTGGFLGIGDQLTAVPYEALKWRREKDDDVVFADLTTDKLKSAPKYEHDKFLELFANEQWRKETEAAFAFKFGKDGGLLPLRSGRPVSGERTGDRPVTGERPVNERGERTGDNPVTGERPVYERGEASKPAWCRASELTDAEIRVSSGALTNDGKDQRYAGEDFGEVNDVVIHRDSGRLAAVVVSRGGVAGIGDDLYAIPCHALEHTSKKDELRVTKTMEEMKNAPRLQKDVLAQFDNAAYCEQIENFYGVKMDGSGKKDHRSKDHGHNPDPKKDR